MFAAPWLVAVPTQSLGRSLPKFFSCQLLGCGAWMAVEGGVGFGIAGRKVTLVLWALLFNRSPYNRAKEMTAISVYDYHAFTSPRISSFKPSIKFWLQFDRVLGL
ncbi:hypothetical protein GW17_00055487 [Ensete ventricosum]|nr:hypothetical protein GW17_00055487 [Ensete ventricosum]